LGQGDCAQVRLKMLGESIGMAAEVAHGSCTDLPPGKK
jgi:hypothetical protein